MQLEKGVWQAHRTADLMEFIHADARRSWVWLGGENLGREEMSVAADSENPSCGILEETDQVSREGSRFSRQEQSASAGLLTV